MSEPVTHGGRPARDVYKILTIDGGGYKGLYSASLLCVLEENYGPLLGHFDMICGTSTGGLIALALSAGKSTKDVVRFYTEYGSSIFPGGSSRIIPKLARAIFHKSRYSSAPLRQGLSEVLGDARMRDAQCALCIPAYDVTNAHPRVFKTPHHPDLTRDDDIPMIEVGLATSAAPTYFPIAKCPEMHVEGCYIDGGVWGNNPALVGLVEALRFFVGADKPYNSLALLSVGNVSPPAGYGATGRYPVLPWPFASALLEAASEGQQLSIHRSVTILSKSLPFNVLYHRIEPHRLSVPQAKDIGLDKASTTATRTLQALGVQQGQLQRTNPNVQQIFSI